ncbi:GNAT family N-acetyltransferase [Microbispora sp. H10949]|uniref:GNAT family N-acetyltransferase n=1 Tax=Microbispora sp. H10949 TaxID=2729111 RepID=UPI0016030621|nr:GNAT family N-acetyltransferase [Microbispora sp. H10949]
MNSPRHPGTELRYPIPNDRGPGTADEQIEARCFEVWIRRHPAGGRPAEWLQDIRRFRAEVFYDQGRRPGFRAAQGEYADSQDLDLGAFHLTAHLDTTDEIVACVRLAPPGLAAGFQARRHLGGQAYAELLAELGAANAPVFEAGRLVVASGMQGRGLGGRMVAAMVATARALGASLVVCTSGTGHRQDVLFGRLGFHPCPGTDRYSTHYQDTVRVLAHRVSEGAYEFEAVTSKLRRGLDDLPRAEVARIPL